MLEAVNQEDIVKRYTEIIKSRKKYSNCYFSMKDLYDKLQERRISAYETDTAFLIIEKAGQLDNLYYMCDSWEWIQGIKDIKKDHQRIAASIVQKKESDNQKMFLDYGYSVYKTYQRLRRTKEVQPYGEDMITDYCTPKDKVRLRKMMNDTFDVLSDHIPTDRELDYFIRQKSIICVRMDDIVTGFIIFEDKGKTSYIRMVCIDGAYRGNGLGNYLMKVYFQIHREYKSFTLWYDMNNKPAYSLYHKWGYEKEDMYNLIYEL